MNENMVTLPMVPLRGLVVFPSTVLNFEVAREVSIKALKVAMENDQRVFLVAQKDLRMELPGEEDIYKVGCVAKVRHILKLGGGAIRVLIEGLYRAKMVTCTQGDCYMAEVIPCENHVVRDAEMEAYMRAMLEKYEEYGNISGKVSPETVLALAEIISPVKLVDTVATNLLKKTENKQEILETFDVLERYKKTIDAIVEEIRISEIEREISARTKVQMDKMQKEHYLREQMRAIQSSLGEDEAEASEIAQFKQKIDEMPVCEATKAKLQKEVVRLERMNSQSPDYNVLRTYLEWVTGLPYGIYTEDDLDIRHAKKVLDADHFGMDDVKERILEFLSVLKLKNNLKGSIICFVGPPGVGKTSIARSIADAMGRKFVRMSLGGVRDEAEIRGHRRTYIGAIPGRIVSSIKQAGTMNPVFLLDEIDKMSSDFRGDPASAMLEVLDPEINATFQDHYLDMEFDLSDVLFLTTANDESAIPR
ncbi:MAG: LON peptidase substrate-binding domain-containing protein, partial [Christensenellaceae bacterium]|nr:LON peptidase substrate-binding domain-containing protein [Christensenellaceae bacterium]